MGDPTERDWQHLRKIRDVLLARLCARIKPGTVKRDWDISLLPTSVRVGRARLLGARTMPSTFCL